MDIWRLFFVDKNAFHLPIKLKKQISKQKNTEADVNLATNVRISLL